MNRLLLITLSLLFASCLKEKDHDCPPAYEAEIAVGDMNYANAGTISGIVPLDEQLPFGSYITSLYWQLQDIASGQVVMASGSIIPGGNAKTYPLDFSALPSGNYLFTAFGNIADNPFQGDSYTLHTGGQEGTDTYRVSQVLNFSNDYVRQRIPMLRTKGGLLVQIENLPDTVTKIVQQVYTVYRDVNNTGNYLTETDVVKTFTSGLHPEPLLFTYLAPSVSEKQSVLRLSLYSGQSELPFMFLPDIVFTLKRNEISSFKVTIKPEGGIEVWINSDGSWIKYHEIVLN